MFTEITIMYMIVLVVSLFQYNIAIAMKAESIIYTQSQESHRAVMLCHPRVVARLWPHIMCLLALSTFCVPHTVVSIVFFLLLVGHAQRTVMLLRRSHAQTTFTHAKRDQHQKYHAWFQWVVACSTVCAYIYSIHWSVEFAKTYVYDCIYFIIIIINKLETPHITPLGCTILLCSVQLGRIMQFMNIIVYMIYLSSGDTYASSWCMCTRNQQPGLIFVNQLHVITNTRNWWPSTATSDRNAAIVGS